MNQKELRRLGKPELIDLVTEQESIIEKLQSRVEDLEAQLRDRAIKIDQAGNLAEASLSIHQVFESAQNAAKQYLENIESLNARTEAICKKREDESNAKCQTMLEECKAKCQALETKVKTNCENVEKTTEQKISARWNEFTMKVDQYIEAHGELQGLLKGMAEKEK